MKKRRQSVVVQRVLSTFLKRLMLFTFVHVVVSSSFVARRHGLLTLNWLRTAA